MTYLISTQEEVAKYPHSVHYAFYESTVLKGFWQTANGIELFYASAIPEHAKACVVISPGRAEATLKYAELIYELYHNGYAVFIFDHQGQGQSSRQLANPHIGYVASFDDYVDDMHVLLDKVLPELLINANQAFLDKYLLCHSMGGAIGTLFIAKYPQFFSKVVLSAPMIGVNVPLPESLTAIIVSTTLSTRRVFNLPERHFWGQTGYQAYPFYKNRLTTSEVRYRVFRQVMANSPDAQLGGIGFTWLQQAIVAMRKIRNIASTINTPCLVFKAQNDQIVSNECIDEIVNAMPNARSLIIVAAEHEILFEVDEARQVAIKAMFEFFDSNHLGK